MLQNTITAYEESQWNRDSHFLIRSVFFVSKDNLFDVHSNHNCFKRHLDFVDCLEKIRLDISCKSSLTHHENLPI